MKHFDAKLEINGKSFRVKTLDTTLLVEATCEASKELEEKITNSVIEECYEEQLIIRISVMILPFIRLHVCEETTLRVFDLLLDAFNILLKGDEATIAETKESDKVLDLITDFVSMLQGLDDANVRNDKAVERYTPNYLEAIRTFNEKRDLESYYEVVKYH